MAEQARVTIPKEVAEAIEGMRRKLTNLLIVVSVYGGVSYTETPYIREIEILRHYFISTDSEDLLLSALVNGYEVEQSPEEQLREYYGNIVEYEECWREVSDFDAVNECMAERDGVINTLGILGITIEGINDKKEDK